MLDTSHFGEFLRHGYYWGMLSLVGTAINLERFTLTAKGSIDKAEKLGDGGQPFLAFSAGFLGVFVSLFGLIVGLSYFLIDSQWDSRLKFATKLSLYLMPTLFFPLVIFTIVEPMRVIGATLDPLIEAGVPGVETTRKVAIANIVFEFAVQSAIVLGQAYFALKLHRGQQNIRTTDKEEVLTLAVLCAFLVTMGFANASEAFAVGSSELNPDGFGFQFQDVEIDKGNGEVETVTIMAGIAPGLSVFSGIAIIFLAVITMIHGLQTGNFIDLGCIGYLCQTYQLAFCLFVTLFFSIVDGLWKLAVLEEESIAKIIPSLMAFLMAAYFPSEIKRPSSQANIVPMKRNDNNNNNMMSMDPYGGSQQWNGNSYGSSQFGGNGGGSQFGGNGGGSQFGGSRFGAGGGNNNNNGNMYGQQQPPYYNNNGNGLGMFQPGMGSMSSGGAGYY